MSHPLAVGDPVARPAAAHERVAARDPRRALQLALGALWLLDGMLQFQPSMFGHGFAQMLAGSAQGNPAVVARPINWSAGLIGHHVVALNAIFAAIQLLLGLGIAWRPAVKVALAGSVAWSLAVWWLGEGLGGVLAGTASPVDGAPGAVLLYGLLAVLLWPADRRSADRRPADRRSADRRSADRYPAAPFTAARAVGRRVAQASWLVVWLSLAALALLPASRAVGRTIADTTPGEPAWLARTDAHVATALTRHGLLAAVVLAVVFVVVASGTFLPRRAARAAIVLAVAVAAALWLAQGLGGILTGSATDPDTGPLLALLALAFWPLASSTGETYMGAPAWLTGSFAALILTVATYCAGRLAVARRWRRPTELDTDAGHVLMGVAMAGMLVARLRILPAATWEVVFAAGVGWFAWQLVKSRRPIAAAPWRCLHPAPHLVECVAMLYMFLAAAPLTARAAAAGMTGLAPSRFSVLALLMALFMVGYVVRVADRLPLRTPTADRLSLRTPAPAITRAAAPALAMSPATPAPMITPAPPSTFDPPITLAPVAHVPATARPHLAPRCAALCKIAMGLTMAYMLVLML